MAINVFPLKSNIISVESQMRDSAKVWRSWLFVLIAVTTLTGVMLVRGGATLQSIAWFFFFVGILALLYEPRYGVYQVIGLSLAGDSLLTPWFPFVKNLSSVESLLYFGRATSFSPAEIFIVLTFLSWLTRAATKRKLDGYSGPLFWPALVFSFFITFGLIWGLAHHGDKRIALWEVRVIYYLPAMLILTSNLIKTRSHINTLIWIISCALFFDSISGVWFVATALHFNLHSVEAIAEHSYSIHLNTIFVLAIAVWFFRGSRAKRVVLPLMMPTMLFSYFANQRRASFITLALALALMTFILYRTRRKLFWTLAPIGIVLGVIYLAAFWNSSGGLGMPARAIRSVIAPQEGSRDDSSNVYRVLENLNTAFTIKSHPFVGVGFGNKFYIIVPLPDISIFEWWEYITHNSIMWIWMQAGVGCFVALLMMVGMAVIVGTRAFWRMPGGDLSAIALTATMYIVMHFVYAYVDMSWEAQSMIYVGTMMGLLNCLEHIVAQPLPRTPPRWPWQTSSVPSLEYMQPQERSHAAR